MRLAVLAERPNSTPAFIIPLVLLSPVERDRDSGSFSFRKEQVDPGAADRDVPRARLVACFGSVKWTGEIDGAGYTCGRKYLRSAFVKSRGSFCPSYEESVCLGVITSVPPPPHPRSVDRSIKSNRIDRSTERPGKTWRNDLDVPDEWKRVSLATLLTSIGT